LSGVPLGWVGSSPKSAGLAITSLNVYKKNKNKAAGELEKVSVEYKEKILKSNLKFNSLAGDFSFGSCILYFWQALMQTQNLRRSIFNRLIFSKLFKTIMFSRVLLEMKRARNTSLGERCKKLKRIVDINNCNYSMVQFLSKISCPEIISMFTSVSFFYFFRLFSKTPAHKKEIANFRVNYSENQDIGMLKASELIYNIVSEKKIIKSLDLKC